MTAVTRLALVVVVLVLLLALGAWYYLFGPNQVASADLVPSDTLVFASIPNAARIAAGYQTSQLKKLLDAPESKPLRNELAQVLGARNLNLLQSLMPELSGQSFLAVTRFDPNDLGHIGLVGGLKPKPGTGSLEDLVAKLKAAYPEVLAQGTTGTGQVEGLDYQWIKGPGASDKICVAQEGGWIITAWGEESLRDWWERSQKKSTGPSLSQNIDYQKSLKRVGADSEAVVFIDYHTVVGLLQNQLAKQNPAQADYFGTKMRGFGALALGTAFEHGEIADRFSILIPKEAQLAAGLSPTPCAYDTLKFTGPDTRFYWGSSANFTRTWQNIQEQSNLAPNSNQAVNSWAGSLQNWAQNHNLDLRHNVIAPLGNEFSVQMEWPSDSSYPSMGFLVKLDKPDDFKPTIAALIDTVRQAYATSAVVNEINSDGQNFATLKFLQALPVSPTITENGPYFGLFSTETQAVRSFKRDSDAGLANNTEFKRQLGDRKNNSMQIIFIDTPQLLNRAYQTALPYVSLAAMFNRTLGAMVQGHTLPSDLQWLAPIKTWFFVSSSDSDGVSAYSVSGIGNQGIFLGGAAFGAMSAFRVFHPPTATPALNPVPAPEPAMTTGGSVISQTPSTPLTPARITNAVPDAAPASAAPPLTNVQTPPDAAAPADSNNVIPTGPSPATNQ